jgi:predicted nuclease of predicted toxin-antitoxin system
LRLLFDQNLSRKLVARLQDLYPNSSHVQFHALAEVTDTEIWNFAKKDDFYIVTQIELNTCKISNQDIEVLAKYKYNGV